MPANLQGCGNVTRVNSALSTKHAADKLGDLCRLRDSLERISSNLCVTTTVLCAALQELHTGASESIHGELALNIARTWQRQATPATKAQTVAHTIHA